jgi:hypothetical protein
MKLESNITNIEAQRKSRLFGNQFIPKGSSIHPQGIIDNQLIRIITYFQTHKLCKTNPILSAVGGFQMNINSFITSNYEISSAGSGQKTNPIQTQTNPILGQYQGWQSQNEPNSNPISNETMLIWANISGCLKYRFPNPFLIKSWPKIAEKREIMAFTVLKRPKNHEKAVRNPIW